MSAAITKKTIGQNEWTIMSVNGSVSISAEIKTADLDGMACSIELASLLGIAVDVYDGFSDVGFSCVTFQLAAGRIDVMSRVLAKMAA